MSRGRRTVRISRRGLLILLACAGILPIWQAWAAAIVAVVQQGRAFSTAILHVHAGDTIRFSNEDEFDHQVYVQSPSFTFESEEASPGTKLDMTLTSSGTFEVRCHIHPRMHLTVVAE